MIMTRQSFQRLTTSVVVAVALALGSAVSAHATTLIVKYTLAGGTQTGIIKVPKNVPVLLVGNQTVVGDVGVGQVVVQNIPTEALQWAGSSSADGPVNNFSSSGHIMFIDFFSEVELTVSPYLVKGVENFGFIIKNTGGSPLTGQVRLIF
jgi:hypothetical protein